MNTKWIFLLIGIGAVSLFVLALTHQIQMQMSSAWMLGIGGSLLLVLVGTSE